MTKKKQIGFTSDKEVEKEIEKKSEEQKKEIKVKPEDIAYITKKRIDLKTIVVCYHLKDGSVVEKIIEE